MALLLGYVLPRHFADTAPAAGSPNGTATVPAQLLVSDQPPVATFASPATAIAQVVVYVCGAVHRPGVYKFGPGLRVTDGIARAGGAVAGADLEQLNLAEPLRDAMKIDVPKKGQIIAADLVDAQVGERTSRRRTSHRGGRSNHKLQPGQTLDINAASEAELTMLPGVGPGLARRIAEYRATNGPFQSVDDLQNVSGIGPSKFDRMVQFIKL